MLSLETPHTSGAPGLNTLPAAALLFPLFVLRRLIRPLPRFSFRLCPPPDGLSLTPFFYGTPGFFSIRWQQALTWAHHGSPGLSSLPPGPRRRPRPLSPLPFYARPWFPWALRLPWLSVPCASGPPVLAGTLDPWYLSSLTHALGLWLAPFLTLTRLAPFRLHPRAYMGLRPRSYGFAYSAYTYPGLVLCIFPWPCLSGWQPLSTKLYVRPTLGLGPHHPTQSSCAAHARALVSG